MEDCTVKEPAQEWDKLPNDCLVAIFAKVDTEYLVQSVQYVCKSWLNATLDPLCWNVLNFLDDISFAFVKCVVDRSQKSATVVLLNGSCPEEGLVYIFNQCTNLKALCLTDCILADNGLLICDLIGKCQNLEYFVKKPTIDSSSIILCEIFHFKEHMESISIHCQNLKSLIFTGTDFWDEHIEALINFLPKIKILSLQSCSLSRDQIVMILQGCRDLDYFVAKRTIGFEPDKELLELSSHIKYVDFSESKYDDFLEKIMEMRDNLIAKMGESFISELCSQLGCGISDGE